MSTPIENNTGALQEILQTVNNLPDAESGGQFVVNFSDDSAGCTADKTFAQIQDAYKSGKTVVGSYLSMVWQLSVVIENNMICFINANTNPDGSVIGVQQLMLAANNTITYAFGYSTLSPEIPGQSTSDYTTYRTRYISLQQDEVTTAPANGEIVGVYTIS